MKIFNKKNLYLLGSFMAGFSVMTIELVSSRIVAPIIGSSVYTWTSIIGITLFGLSIGSWIGGLAGDKIKNNNLLSFIFFISSILVSLIPIFAQNTKFLIQSSNSILLLNILTSTYLFFVPAIAIGMIQPIILKKYADNFSKIATEYGLLSSAWSIGSVLGVFVTGFFFISTIGSLETVWVIVSLLLITGLFFVRYDKKTSLYIACILIILVSIFLIQNKAKTNRNLFEKETNYYKARVADMDISGFGKSRLLFLDFDSHSIMPEKTNEFYYPEIYPVFSNLKKDIKDILVIGAGAYTLPKYFKEFYKETNVSVIELDPELKKIAEDYFDLKKYDIETKIGDAKMIISKENKKYDVIFGDAYNSFISVPWYLLTNEWNYEIKKNLKDNGIYAINFIGEREGDGSKITSSIINTFKISFPNFYIFCFGANTETVQNIVLVGINGNLPLKNEDLKKLLSQGKNKFLADRLLIKELQNDPNSIILTDNFSPVEKLMDPIIKSFFKNNLSLINKIK